MKGQGWPSFYCTWHGAAAASGLPAHLVHALDGCPTLSHAGGQYTINPGGPHPRARGAGMRSNHRGGLCPREQRVGTAKRVGLRREPPGPSAPDEGGHTDTPCRGAMPLWKRRRLFECIASRFCAGFYVLTLQDTFAPGFVQERGSAHLTDKLSAPPHTPCALTCASCIEESTLRLHRGTVALVLLLHGFSQY